MKKYKILRSGEGFSIWMLKDFGEGCAWEIVGKGFTSEQEAQKAIEKERENDEQA